MTDGFEVPAATATVLLQAVVARVTALADRLGVRHAEVFDVRRLSAESGVPGRGAHPAERPTAPASPICRPGSSNASTCCGAPG